MDELAPEIVETQLTGRFGRPYLYEMVCVSTQDLLRGRALPEGAVAVADHQTAGRGRSGRRWEDTSGASLLVSVVLRPAERLPAELSLVCALAVAETVEHVAELDAQVKWPNDVLLRDAKVAGILLEADGGAVIAGIGLNVNQTVADLPGETRTPAGSLRSVTGREHARAPLLAALLAELERRYDEWQADGIRPLATTLERRNWLRGQRVSSGERRGTAGRIRDDGLLELRLDGGETIAVVSGEIVLLPCDDQLHG